MSDSAVILCENLVKQFIDVGQPVDVLIGLSLSIAKGEKVALVGPSGSGKTTFLQCLGGLDRPTSGEVRVAGVSLNQTSEKQLAMIRNQQLGFVYQFHHLLPEFSALENVMMPLLIANTPVPVAVQQASDILGRVGLSHRLSHRPAQLSGGERQRTAIARALVTQPVCVLADEPTGNLDRQNASQIYDMIFELNQAFNTSFLIATHDLNLAEKMDRIVHLHHGKIFSDTAA